MSVFAESSYLSTDFVPFRRLEQTVSTPAPKATPATARKMSTAVKIKPQARNEKRRQEVN